MSLKDKLFADLKEAMKQKDTVRKEAIQMVRAGILQIEKDKKIELDDDGVVEVVAKELKKYNDVLPDYEKSGRQDSIDELNRKIEILNAYLPEQLTEEDLIALIDEKITVLEATSVKDMGKVMGALAPLIKGKADKKTVGELVKKRLQN